MPTRTAIAVERLIAASARLVGNTHTDELAWSLNGENAYYGTPVNPNAPGRIPGGSCGGSRLRQAIDPRQGCAVYSSPQQFRVAQPLVHLARGQSTA